MDAETLMTMFVAVCMAAAALLERWAARERRRHSQLAPWPKDEAGRLARCIRRPDDA